MSVAQLAKKYPAPVTRRPPMKYTCGRMHEPTDNASDWNWVVLQNYLKVHRQKLSVRDKNLEPSAHAARANRISCLIKAAIYE